MKINRYDAMRAKELTQLIEDAYEPWSKGKQLAKGYHVSHPNWSSSKYTATIAIAGVNVYVGSFKTEAEAERFCITMIGIMRLMNCNEAALKYVAWDGDENEEEDEL